MAENRWKKLWHKICSGETLPSIGLGNEKILKVGANEGTKKILMQGWICVTNQPTNQPTNTGQRKSKVPDLVIPSIAPLARLEPAELGAPSANLVEETNSKLTKQKSSSTIRCLCRISNESYSFWSWHQTHTSYPRIEPGESQQSTFLFNPLIQLQVASKEATQNILALLLSSPFSLKNIFPKAPELVVSDRFQQFIGIVNAYCKSLRRLHSQTWFRQSQIMWTEPWAEPFDGWESLEKTLTWFLFGGNAPINWVRKWKNTQSWGKWGHKKNIDARLDLCD